MKPEKSVEETLDVIAVGAHPDDCEIGCGGTLAKLAMQGYRVGIVDLTNGEPTPGCDLPETRIAEAHAAADCLGITKRIVLDLPNRMLFDSFEARVALAREFRIYRPRLVIGLGSKTPMASPDHWAAMQITDAAVFYSRLSKWDQYFGDLPVHPIERQIYYSLFFEANWSATGRFQFVSDISETLQKKLDAIRCYQTQFPPEKGYLYERVQSMALVNGAVAGFHAGEVLASTRAIGSRDVMQTVLGM
jgi:LmbE family N-acetylglucosaminyl deacetylase